MLTTLRRPEPETPEDAPSTRADDAVRLVAGAVLMAGAAWFAWSLPATQSRRSRPSAPLVDGIGPWQWLFDHAAPPASPNRLAASLVVVTAAFFAAWAAIVVSCHRQRSRHALRWVLVMATVVIAISTLALPNKTSDIYDYALFGRVVSVHGGAPYRDVPDRYPDDPLRPYVSGQYTSRPDNKLPVWTATTVALTSVTGDNPRVNLMAFRLLLGGSTVATTALIGWILTRIRPGAAASGAAMFGLNPITIVHGPEKTDALMALLLVGGLALVVAGRHYVATGVLTLSVLVKLITAPVLVLVVAMPLPALSRSGVGEPSLRSHVRSVLLRAAIALGVVVGTYAWFPDPTGLARDHLSGADRASVLPGLHTAAVGLFALGLAAVTAASWVRRPETPAGQVRALVDRSALIMIVFSVFLTRPGLPWYLMCALAVSAITASRVLFVLLAALCSVSFLMGWWDAIGTPAYPLPTFEVGRPVVYLAVAAMAMALSLVTALVTHNRRTVEVTIRSQ